jgi:hypothetical protein
MASCRLSKLTSDALYVELQAAQSLSKLESIEIEGFFNFSFVIESITLIYRM